MGRPTGSVVCRMEATHTCVSPGVRVRRNSCIRQQPSWPQANVLIATFISSVKTQKSAQPLVMAAPPLFPALVERACCFLGLRRQPEAPVRFRWGRAAVNVLGCDPQSAVRRGNCSWLWGWRESSPLGLAVCSPMCHHRSQNSQQVAGWPGRRFVLFFHWHSCAVYKHKFNLPVFI